jgi:hypothetical protein
MMKDQPSSTKLIPLSQVLQRQVPAALIEVFGSYGARVTEKKTPPTDPKGAFIPVGKGGGESLAAGVIGFTGDRLQGTLLLATSFDVVARVRPADLQKRAISATSAADWIMVRDWVRELTNLILGRIKSHLRPYGVKFEMAPPSALSGPALAFAVPKSPAPQRYLFECEGEKVWLCFDGMFDPALEVEFDGVERASTSGRAIVFDE